MSTTQTNQRALPIISTKSPFFILPLLLLLCLMFTNCDPDPDPDPIEEDVCELQKSTTSTLLIDNKWINPTFKKIVGFDIWSSNGCYNTYDFDCESMVSIQVICSPFLESTYKWSWLKEDEIIDLGRPPQTNNIRFFKIVNITSAKLEAILFWNEEDELTKYIEMEYTSN